VKTFQPPRHQDTKKARAKIISEIIRRDDVPPMTTERGYRRWLKSLNNALLVEYSGFFISRRELGGLGVLVVKKS
jgi:hypothetical protein